MKLMFKLGTIVTDTATGLQGMLTHLLIEQGGSNHYSFQPRGLNPETGAPVKKIWLSPERIEKGVPVEVPITIPMAALGTEAEDTASGFKGTVVGICLHLTGCFHVTLQPKGKLDKTGNPIEPMDFDIRRIKGPFIPVFSEEQVAVDQQRKPSPGGFEPYSTGRLC